MCIRRSQGGLTLIELVMFIVVVSVGVAGLLPVFDLSVSRSVDPMQAKQAIAVAESMLDEILAKDFSNPTSGYAAACPGTCVRASFDDVGDYNGYTSVGVVDITTGATIPGLASYSVAVTVATSGAAIGGVTAANILVVTVTVSVGGSSYSLTGYRFNNG